MTKVLLVEDVDSLRDVLKTVLENEGYEVSAVGNAEDALKYAKTLSFGCILSDFKLPGNNGLDLLREVREFNKNVPFLLMTAYGSIDIAVQAMKNGANDFITKPFEPAALCTMLSEVVKHRQIIDRTLGSRSRRDRKFMTVSPLSQKILQQAKKAARVDTSVMLLGESGTGKELIARYIHDNSPRADKPFIAVNCAAMPPDLLESEFFGHEAGSFTGATQTRVGVFELASEGTIFLDEVGDMPLALQVKLLRALQQGEIKKVGSNRMIKVSPRVVSATNHDMEEDLKQGIVREDFYYRLAVVCLTIPPLRERTQDITLLSDFYVEYFANLMGKPNLALNQHARKMLLSYSWPGNARELENVIERASVLAESEIGAEHLGINPGLDLQSIAESTYSLPEIAARAARQAEVELITRILGRTMGNKSKAAELLGVSYKTLLNKVKEYKIEAPA